MKKIILFIESNTTGSGMLALQKAKNMGFDPVFLTNNPDRYLGLKDSDCPVLKCNTNNISSLYTTINQNIDTKNIVGITTTSEFYLGTVSELAGIYNLPRNSLNAIKQCRNKAETRICLSKMGVKQPKFKIINSMFEINDALKEISFPCIVKPVDDSGSNSVRLCETADSVRELVLEILSITRNSRGQETIRKVLVEEYIDAPEYSVETFTKQGVTTFIGITEKQVKGFPYFVEHEHIFPAPLDSATEEEIIHTVKNSLDAVGINNGPTHTEVKLTPEGCKVIEINARLAGGMIPELIKISTGIDMLSNQILLSTGRYELPSIQYKKYAGIKFMTSNHDGIFADIKGIDSVLKLSGIQQIKVLKNIGDKVTIPKNAHDRLGFIIAEASLYEDIKKLLKDSEERIQINIQNERVFT